MEVTFHAGLEDFGTKMKKKKKEGTLGQKETAEERRQRERREKKLAAKKKKEREKKKKNLQRAQTMKPTDSTIHSSRKNQTQTLISITFETTMTIPSLRTRRNPKRRSEGQSTMKKTQKRKQNLNYS